MTAGIRNSIKSRGDGDRKAVHMEKRENTSRLDSLENVPAVKLAGKMGHRSKYEHICTNDTLFSFQIT